MIKATLVLQSTVVVRSMPTEKRRMLGWSHRSVEAWHNGELIDSAESMGKLKARLARIKLAGNAMRSVDPHNTVLTVYED